MKKEKRVELYKNYMFNENLNNTFIESNIKQAEAFGYIDGFFNEHIYEEYIKENEKYEYREAYSKYFKIGRNDWLNEESSKSLKEEKEWFIKELVKNDLLNNKYRNCFTDQYQHFYDEYMKYGEIDLSNGDIKISKSRK